MAVLTYVPSPDGYFKHRFEMIKLILAALHANTEIEHDLMVFDNGSYPEVIDHLIELKQQNKIDYLYLSRRNIGNFGALRRIFSSAPGEVVAYLDDDVFVYPGWLREQLLILDHYPNVGMVSGVPVRNAARHAYSSLEKWLENPPAGLKVNRGRFIPDEWEYDWAVSTGRSPEEFLEATKEREDNLLDYNGVKAIGSANHFQFVGYKDVLLKGLPKDWDQRLMGDMLEFDERLDQLGYLRLSTPELYVRHIGNTINEEMQKEAQTLGVEDVGARAVPFTKKHWILYIPRSRNILKAIYNWLFKVLFLHDKLK